jgi:hypothetical protein
VSIVVCDGGGSVAAVLLCGMECNAFAAVFWGLFVTFISPFVLALYPFSVVLWYWYNEMYDDN